MNRLYLLIVLSLCIHSSLGAEFSEYFEDKTLRVDYFHTGKIDCEIFSLDQLYEQGKWAGSKINSNKLLYSRGFSSIYGEWETTAEAQKTYRTFHESVLVPFPQKPIRLIIAKRNEKDLFTPIWDDCQIDPDAHFINRADVRKDVKVIKELGDGFTEQEQNEFKKIQKEFVQLLFRTAPFNRRKNDFNVRAIAVRSRDSGISEPRKNQWKNNACGCSFNTFDLPRYVLSFNNKDLRDIAAAAPYDFLAIIFNSDRYGGGGIYNLLATSFAGSQRKGDEWMAEYVFTHELGHLIGGLADEYYSSSVAYVDFYPPNVEPWEPNITALLDKTRLKWQNLVDKNTPIPTPWDKAKYDSIAADRSYLAKGGADYAHKQQFKQQELADFLHTQKYWGRVGAFEGAGYRSQGLYRPALDCRMFSRSMAEFDPVCQAAIERVIDFYSR